MINDDIVKLHELRKQLATANNLWKAKAAQFDLDNKELREEAKRLVILVEAKEIVVRLAAVDDYKVNSKSKSVAPGVNIQDTVKKSLSYDDDKALGFAKEKDMFLSLDKDGFEAYALNAPKLPEFVTVNQERVIKATIAKDLFTAVNEIQEAVNVQ